MIKVKQKGFFIIEALIAIFVFAVGILGVIKIQGDTIQTTSDAFYRVQASFFAQNMIGKITLDKPNASKYTSTGNAEYDDWIAEIAAALPGSTSDNVPVVTVTDSGVAKIVKVEIFWQPPMSNGNVSKFVTETTIF
jgi:type IV pilus assembly protein PilV